MSKNSFDTDHLLLTKSFSQLSAEEREMILNIFENEEEYNDAQSFLRQSSKLFETEKKTVKNDDSRYSELQLAFRKKHQKNYFSAEKIQSYINYLFPRPAVSFSIAASIAIVIILVLILKHPANDRIIISPDSQIVQIKPSAKDVQAGNKTETNKIITNLETKYRKSEKTEVKATKKEHKQERISDREITIAMLSINDSTIQNSKMSIMDISKLTEYEAPGMKEGSDMIVAGF